MRLRNPDIRTYPKTSDIAVASEMRSGKAASAAGMPEAYPCRSERSQGPFQRQPLGAESLASLSGGVRGFGIGSNMIVLLKEIRCGALCVLFSLAWTLGSVVVAQEEDNEEVFWNMSLEKLNQVVVTASWHEESVFESPLGATVISGEQVRRSGASNIPEALRLVPGMIVREQNAGNFDVHMRGLDNTPPGSILRYSVNNLTLVMIDDRVVYNHFTGGVFWDSLPVDINDIDRIEVVRGASSAMYGPNAVTGVIHIITKNPQDEVHNFGASAALGTDNGSVGSVDLGFGLGKNWVGRAAINWNQRDRETVSYYDFGSAMYVDDVQELTAFFDGTNIENFDEEFPEPMQSLDRFSGNLWLSGVLENDVAIHASIGGQHVESQKVYDDNAATPLTTNHNDSIYGNLIVEASDVKLHASYEKGESDVLGAPFFSFEYENIDLQGIGNFDVGGWTWQPLLQYRVQEYMGLYATDDPFDGELARMKIASAALRMERDSDSWLWSLSGRGDRYDFSGETEISYLATGMWKTGGSDDWVVRGSIGKSHQEPFMAYTFEKTFFEAPLVSMGNQDLDLLEVDNIELGFRGILGSKLSLDGEIFHYKARNYSDIYATGETLNGGGLERSVLQYQNLDTTSEMTGATLSLEYADQYWDATVFLTLQSTDIENWTQNRFFSLAPPQDSENLSTPENYGGFAFNYRSRASGRLNLNLSGYFFGRTQHINFYSVSNPNVIRNVDDKVLLNTRASYQLNEELELFISVRNLLDNESREFGLLDKIGRTIFVGVDARFSR